MKSIIKVLFLSLLSLASYAQTQTFKGDTAATVQANRVNIGANAAGRVGQKGSTGNHNVFAFLSEVQASMGISQATGDGRYVQLAGSYANPSWLTSLASSKVGLGNLVNSLQVINAGGIVSQAAGTLASRPAAATAGRSYYATDTKTWYYDNGTGWDLSEPAITGDVTIPAGGTIATLPNVNSNTGAFGAAGTVPVVTVNAKGQVTAVGTATITPSAIGAADATTTTTTFATKADKANTIYRANAATYAAVTSTTVPAGETWLIKVANDETQSAPYTTNQWYLKDDTGLTFKIALIK